ncbi:hypothetical protein [Panacagrimonas sp.]|uniref:hypothetical protein n=1 Tax=Panacagrimonas sp. TaxID=2480088 RepID=UPI003B52F67F
MHRIITVAWLATMLAACSDASLEIGEGTQPVELFLGVDSRLTSLAMDECTNVQIGAFVRFEGDAPTIGDFSARADFRSSDPTTVYVGDGVSPSPDGVVYPPGALIALKTGLATITATYLDFTSTLAVQVEPLGSLRVEPPLTDIAEDLPQKFDLIAAFSQARPEEDVSEIAVWSFEPATARAAVDIGGEVQANSFRDDQTLTLVARVPECGRRAQTRFRVSAIDRLELEYEFGDDARMPLGTSEVLRVYARFPDPESTPQNLSRSIEVENLPDDFLAATVVRSGPGETIEELLNPVNIRNDLLLVTALEEAGMAGFEIEIDSGAGWRTSTRVWELLDTGLDRVSVSPEEVLVRYPDTAQLNATGIFANGMQRDISRHVLWTPLNSSALLVSTAADAAGEITVGDTDQDVEVEVFAEQAQQVTTDYALVRIYSSSNELPQGQTP